MTTHKNLLLALLIFALSLNLVACVEPEEEEPAQKPAVMLEEQPDGKGDVPSQEEDKTPEPEPEVIDDEPLPFLMSVRFIRQFKTCEMPECFQELEFALSTGVMWRFEHRERVEMVWLTDEEHARLLRLVTADDFEGAVREGDFGCPARTDDDFNVALMILSNDDDVGAQSFVVSGCQDTDDVQETPDDLVDFAIDLERKYD
jgi:hypothetical protein